MRAIVLATARRSLRSRKPIALIPACGVSLLERHVRTLKACGIDDVDVIFEDDEILSSCPREALPEQEKGIRLRTLEDFKRDTGVAATERVVIVLGHYIVEPLLMRAVLEAGGDCVLVDSKPVVRAAHPDGTSHEPVFAGIAVVGGAGIPQLASACQKGTCPLEIFGDVRRIDLSALPTFDPGLRRDRQKIWIRVADRDDLPAAEARLIKGVQKGSLDWPAQVLHAPIENRLVERICRTSVTPNQLTLITNIVAWGVTAMILGGYLMSALLLATVVGVLDGLDGKLARLKLMTSKVGKLEHAFDMVFEYSWWFALGWFLSGGDHSAPAFVAGMILILCNFADTAASVLFWLLIGREHGRTLDNYTPLDLAIRKVSGRRNIYVWLILLSATISSVESGLWAAVAWGLVTAIVRTGRTFAHLFNRDAKVSFEFVVD